MNAEYMVYIKSAKWAAKRELYFKTNGKYCRACAKIDGVIQLHHMTYDRLGNERLSDLVALCPSCHRDVKTFHRKNGGDLRTATLLFIKHRRLNGRRGQQVSKRRTR